MFKVQWFKFGGWRCSPLNAALNCSGNMMTKKEKYQKFLLRLEKRRNAWMKHARKFSDLKVSDFHVPKRENDNEWSENFALDFLKQLGCPKLQEIQGNPNYKKLIRSRQRSKKLADMVTPEFVVGEHFIEPNDPNDLYVDVHEITEGLWGNFDDAKNKFENGNPYKKMIEAVLNQPEQYTSDNPYTMVMNESESKILESLYRNIKQKANKYSSKRGKSMNFGLVSVLSNQNQHLSMIPYQKLILSIFNDMLIPAIAHDPACVEHTKNVRDNLYFISRKAGFVPIVMPFEGDWLFWMIVGSGEYEGDCLCLINSETLNQLNSNTVGYDWIHHLAKP
ncbi:hypothetical protein ACTIRA_003764 [Vibrio parahaemolyticus]